MAIAVDSRNAGTTTAVVNDMSWSHSLASLSNGILVVATGAVHNGASHATVASAVWDSGGANTALSKFGAVDFGADGGSAELWYLLNPASGTKTIKATFLNSPAGSTGSVSLSGVNQATPWNAAGPHTATGTSAAPSNNVTSAAGEWGIDCLGFERFGGGLTQGGSQNLIANSTDGNCYCGMSDEQEAASPIAFSWTGGGSVDWGWVGGSLIAAAAGPAVLTGSNRQFFPNQRGLFLAMPLVQGTTVIPTRSGWGPLIGGRRNRLISDS